MCCVLRRGAQALSLCMYFIQYAHSVAAKPIGVRFVSSAEALAGSMDVSQAQIIRPQEDPPEARQGEKDVLI
eukprot:scaffold390525_cov17-Prasinocladus_malaysianus.AAC.1